MKLPCEFCGEPVDPNKSGTFRKVEGWVENRDGGGAHAVAARVEHHKYAHRICITEMVMQLPPMNQDALFSL